MKKLLVTAIGAAAALGASAGLISTQRFENVTGELPQAATISSLNELAGGTFWSGDELTNTYTYVSCAGESIDPQVDEPPLGTPTKALEVKTTFGSPLTVNAIAGGSSTNIPASGIYFDSLVKFTVCEEEPEQTYDGAKIIMWLQEDYASDGETVEGTNIMVRAGYVNANGTCTPTNFVCYTFDGDIDAWHRVTIKTWADITNGSGIPGFAIFIDNELVNVAGSEKTMADAFVGNLTEAAGYFGPTKVFASLVQGDAVGKTTITSASFDGTGKLTDLVFTDEAPFTAARDYVAPKASITLNNTVLPPFTTLEDAVETLNGVSVEQGQEPVTATFKLLAGVNFEGPLTINNIDENVTIVIDLDGKAITNTAVSGYALILNSPVTITDSSEEKTGAIVSDISGEGNGAIYVGESGALELLAGTIDGYIEQWVDGDAKATVALKGGTVKQDNIDPVDGYMLVAKAGGFYDVVEIATFTATFITYDGSVFDQQANIPSNTLATAPGIPPTRDHYTFAGWTPAVADTPIVSNTTFTATWTVDSYTVKFVYGLNGEKEYSQSYNYGLSPELPGDATETGYNLTWKPAIETVTSNTTYTADYEAQSYTITFNANGGTVDPATTNYTIASGEITLPNAVPTSQMTGVQFAGWTNDTYTVATNKFTPSAANLADFTLFAKWDATGTASFDGGDGNQFDIAPGAQAEVAAKTGHALTDTVTGTTMTYAQAYALGLVDTTTGDVADLDATIEIKDGKVVVGLSSTPLNYTITLKVYEKSSLAAESWTLKATYTLDSETATTGFTPSAGTSNFYKTEVTISNK